MANYQNNEKTRMQAFLENPPFIPWTPFVTHSQYNDVVVPGRYGSIGDGRLRHRAQSWMESADDECDLCLPYHTSSHSVFDRGDQRLPPNVQAMLDTRYDECDLGPPDHRVSRSVFDPSSPEMKEYLHHCIEASLLGPMPQSQLKESRVLSYLKKVRESGTQNVDTPNEELDQVQPETDLRNSSPIDLDEWIDEHDPDITRLNAGLQKLEKAIDKWKGNYNDSMTVEHDLEMSLLEFQNTNTDELLQEEKMNSDNCETDMLELENMTEETGLETEASGNQLSNTDNTYTEAAQMSATETTTGVPEVGSVCVPQVETLTTSTDDETSTHHETPSTDDETKSTEDETKATDDETRATDDETKATDDVNTAADVETTSTDVETTSTDVETTSTDVETTSTDVEITSTDVETTSTDVETTSTDVESTSTDVETTSTDVEATSTDVETTSTDVETTSTDVEATSTDVETTSTDVENTSTDVEATSTDVEATSTDVEATSTDVETTSTDVETTSTHDVTRASLSTHPEMSNME